MRFHNNQENLDWEIDTYGKLVILYILYFFYTWQLDNIKEMQ